MAAFLFSLKQVHPSIELRFGVGTVFAFAIAAGLSWRVCALLGRRNAASGDDAAANRLIQRWMILFMSVSGLGTLAAFGYALKDVSAASRREVIEGTGMAVVVLAMGAWLIFKAYQFFEEQSAAELEQQRRDHEERARQAEEDPDL